MKIFNREEIFFFLVNFIFICNNLYKTLFDNRLLFPRNQFFPLCRNQYLKIIKFLKSVFFFPSKLE